MLMHSCSRHGGLIRTEDVSSLSETDRFFPVPVFEPAISTVVAFLLFCERECAESETWQCQGGQSLAQQC
jgi:hypothetical protein